MHNYICTVAMWKCKSIFFQTRLFLTVPTSMLYMYVYFRFFGLICTDRSCHCGTNLTEKVVKKFLVFSEWERSLYVQINNIHFSGFWCIWNKRFRLQSWCCSHKTWEQLPVSTGRKEILNFMGIMAHILWENHGGPENLKNPGKKKLVKSNK